MHHDLPPSSSLEIILWHESCTHCPMMINKTVSSAMNPPDDQHGEAINHQGTHDHLRSGTVRRLQEFSWKK